MRARGAAWRPTRWRRCWRTDPLQIEPIVESLIEMDWVARLDEEDGPRVVLLADPANTPVRELVDALLLEPSAAASVFRARTGIERLTLGELL